MAVRASLILPLLLAAAGGVQAQSLSTLGSLSFGTFLAGTGGSITIGPTGTRSKGGGVILIGQGGAASAALIAVSGTANASYAITLPADGSVLLSDGAGHTMALTSFTSNPSATGTLSAGGTQMLAVGATLTVAAAQPRGNYSGAFSVTVNYP